MKYPVYIPEITERERELVLDCIESTWISSRGKYINEFESKVESYIGVKHAISVFNGTVALHLTLLSLGIKEGDEVIIPDLTYVATANAVKYCGAKPVFVDVERSSWNIDPELAEKAINSKTKAIICVDLFGSPVDYNRLSEIAETNNIFLISDSAESFGAKYKGKKAGALGDIATFSFFGNKTITTGEGGMVLTNNDQLASYIRMLKNQGNSESVRYFHDIIGYNYRMTNIQAAIGCAQLERITSILDRKEQIYMQYNHELNSVVEFQQLQENTTSSYWMVSVLMNDRAERDNLMGFLESKEIETRPFFYPMSQLPFYEEANNPISNELSKRGISLPSYPTLKEEDISFICSEIKSFKKTNNA